MLAGHLDIFFPYSQPAEPLGSESPDSTADTKYLKNI
jgi:hypothetical protein